MARGERKMKHLSDEELKGLRTKIKAATLGQDAQSRLMLRNFLTYVDAEFRYRAEDAKAKSEDASK